MNDLSIIIVSYNTKNFLYSCLQSVYENLSKNLKFEVIIVDNASSDGSVEMVKKQFEKVTLVKNQENLGFAKANNLGIEKAHGRYLLFLNSDTILHKNTIETIISFMEKNNDAGATTCRINLPDGKMDDACHRGFPTPWNAFCHFSGLSRVFPKSKIFAGYSLGWMDLTKIHEIDACCGAFMIVKRESGEGVNWWNESYFWYGEDLDFCYRLKGKGWKIYFLPTVSILHYKGVSGGIKNSSKKLTTADEETKKLATKARFDAMRIFYKNNYLNKYPKLLTWLIFKGISLKEKLTSYN